MEKKCVSLMPSMCSGCGMCVEICNASAIELKEDEYGFLSPFIDFEKCLNCGLCRKKCPFENPDMLQNSVANEAYAVALKDECIIRKSASGGVFVGLAEYVIEHGGIVFGASMQRDFSVRHIGVESKNDLYRLQGSKYTQSSIINCFKEINNRINSGRLVLFSGTPCQVAAIKSYLGKEYNNFITIDLICHGVGSNKLFQEDVKYIEKKYGKKIYCISFRTKRNGWGTSGDIVFKDSIKDYDRIISPYYYYYLNNTVFRESCYYCPFSCESRCGDLTVGDFWGIEAVHPNINIDVLKGVSCVLINNNKGKQLLNESEEKFELFESSVQEIMKRNHNLVKPSTKPANKNVIDSIYMNGGYDNLVAHWIKTEWSTRMMLNVKKRLSPKLKIQLKKWLKK